MEFQELLLTFSLLYEQVSSSTTDQITRGAFINLAVQNITNRYKWSWRIETITDATSGSDVFNLPDDFSNEGLVTDTVTIGGVLWTKINIDELDQYSDDSTVFYVIGDQATGNQIVFPKSVPDYAEIKLSYYKNHDTLIEDTDTTIIPDGECICNLAVGRFLKSEGEGEEALTFLQDAENGIMDMLKADRRKQPVRRVQKQTRTGVNQFSVDDMY